MRCNYERCIMCDAEPTVKKGRKIYHEECLETQAQCKEIRELFVEKINNNVVFAQLNSVINNIVFSKGLGSDFLLFGLKYYIEHNIPLNYPQGLYYVAQNKDVMKAYQHQKVKADQDKILDSMADNETSFTPIEIKRRNFEDILGGSKRG